MSVVHLILLVLGIVLLVVGVVRLANRFWIDGAIAVVIGLVLLGAGGFINA